MASSSGGGSGSSGGGGSTAEERRGKGGRITHTPEPQPRLQTWLQQQAGLPAEEADRHARRLALLFGSQQAALDGLPAIFEWCTSQGMSRLQTAKLLHCMAQRSHDSVASFGSTARPAWQLIDSYIAAASVRHKRQHKHACLAEVLCSSKVAWRALALPAGHVAAWLEAVGSRLPAGDIGALLIRDQLVLTVSPTTTLAAISWAADELGVEDLAGFFRMANGWLKYDVCTLRANLGSLQQALGITVDQAQQLVRKQPVILTAKADTLKGSVAWLQELFPDSEQLMAVVNRGPQLLTVSAGKLQRRADYLQRQLGWQDSDRQAQLAAFVSRYPHNFVAVDFEGREVQAKLLLLSQVVGVPAKACVGLYSSYLAHSLANMAALYVLVQKRAPQMLFRNGEPSLSWVVSTKQSIRKYGMSAAEVDQHVREWPKTAEGRRLLEGLREGKVLEGWPQGIPPGQQAP